MLDILKYQELNDDMVDESVYTMLSIIKERYLNKIMNLETFDKRIRNLLMIDESNSILNYNIRYALLYGFVYETLLADSVGFDFKFKLIRNDPIKREIIVKIVDVEEF